MTQPSKPRREGFVHTFGIAKYVYLADYERLEQELRDYKWEWEQALERVGHRDDRIAELEEKLKIAVEALETLEVAVNDKINDPGATNFIRKALAKIKGEK